MRVYPILVLLIVSGVACEKAFFKPSLDSNDPLVNADYLWQVCREKYAYFDLKKIDWDSVKLDYQTRIYDGMSNDSLFNVLGNMLASLRDGHANLFSDFNTSFFGTEFLGPDNFDWRVITDHYLGQQYMISGPFQHDFLSNRSLGYVRLSSFPGDISTKSLDFVLTRYQDTKGLILDLRENGGGAIKDVYTVLNRLTETERLVYFSRIKTGSKLNDFSEPEPVFVRPFDGVRYPHPVIVLVDRGTYSSGSLLALATKALPNVTLVGDQTGGGLGMPNGGQLPNGWRYRFSITQTLNLDFSPAWENGVPPDFTASFDWANLAKDEVLERAMELLQ
ncbi:MAG: S41 family peptidase [Saprospiraceae bacterium]|nr:S41 family peptidase [Saprospiraceae bacterium]